MFIAGCQKADDKNKDKNKDQTAETPAGAGKAGALGKQTPLQKPQRPERPQIPPPPDVAAAPADATKTASGVAYKVLTPGKADGDHPTVNDTVVVHYTGWTTDGKTFDSSIPKKRPAEFPLGKLIPGWTEGIQLMKPGEKTRFWIPEDQAYGGRPGAPAGMLVFDVELIDIKAAPKTPDNVAAPPANAKKTKKGVSYVVLKPGKGGAKDRPRAWDKVKVHYTGWTTDGKMFDSSVQRGQPAEFNVGGVIAGWTDALITMVPGQSSRLWIPKELAYDGKPGRPQGMLVFDVELISVERMPEPPPVPKDVAAAPANAKKTEKGVSYRVLKPGKGDGKVGPTSRITVHYTGWTTDGKMFDSSISRGKPMTFDLKHMVPGFTDGVQTMKIGGKSRFWIPQEMAYQGRKGRPEGTLVFDIELLKIDTP
jgi:FKBP-type peptidyl-prolyl cis-trans isomerase